MAFLRRQEPWTQAVAPDFILLDLNLPGTSGYDVLAELYQDPALQFIPAVVLTSSGRQEDINQCYELGANAYLVKPLELEQALSLLRSTVTFWSACKFHRLKDCASEN